MDIGYLSECDSDYARGLSDQDTRAKLRKFTESYRRIADDAYQIARVMSLGDFNQWREGLRKERRGKFAGEEFMQNFGNLLMPQVMFQVSMVASQFHVPWGCAYLRMKDAGRIVEDDDGIASIAPKAAA